MSAPVLELLAPVRAAILLHSEIVARLGSYNGAPSIHTRVPVPESAGYPMIVIQSPTRGDEDGVNDFRPVAVVDINTYGEQDTHYRDVKDIAEMLYGLLHRQRTAITVSNYSVTDLRCTGPAAAPVDDDSRVGRRVTVTARLFAT